MHPMSTRLVSGSVLAVLLFAAPAGIAAEERRGAAVLVLRSDGLEVPGELIAVKPEALILRRGGTDLTIPRPKIHSIQILRRSKRGTGTLIGFLAGASVGALWGVARGPDPIHGHPALIAGPVAGGLGALLGLWVSPGGGVDSTLVFAGSSSLAAAENWDKLRAYSREARRAKAARRP
jgi:hypothetical protein